MKDLMVDLETLGKTPGCVIMSIGAVFFDADSGELGKEFYTVVNVASAEREGLLLDKETISWWGRQSSEARKVIDEAYSEEKSISLRAALSQFREFCHEECVEADIRIWGNGADFDNAILACAFKAADLPPPQQHWNNRCFRTLKALVPAVGKMERRGTYHNALDDAKTQALHAIKCLRWLSAGSL